MARVDWFGALHFLPAMMVDAYLRGISLEKIEQASHVANFAIGTNAPAYVIPELAVVEEEGWTPERSSAIHFLHWLELLKKRGAQRVKVRALQYQASHIFVPQNLQHSFLEGAYRTPFELEIIYPEGSEIWALVARHDQQVWQIGLEEFANFRFFFPEVDELRKEYLRDNGGAWRGGVDNWGLLTQSELGSSPAQHKVAVPSRFLSWLDDRFESGALSDRGLDTRKVWRSWLLNDGLGIQDGLDFVRMQSSEVDTNVSETSWEHVRSELSALYEEADSLLKKVKSGWTLKEARVFLQEAVDPTQDRGDRGELGTVLSLLGSSREAIQVLTSVRRAIQSWPAIWDRSAPYLGQYGHELMEFREQFIRRCLKVFEVGTNLDFRKTS